MEEQDIKHNEILKAVGDLSGKFDGLSEKTDEILEAIGHFSDKTEERFEGIDRRFEGIDRRFEGIDRRFEGVERRLDDIESNMVTKSYLDEKLSDLRGDLVVLTRKEDAKLARLVNILETRQVISPEDAGQVLALEPFPHTR